MRHGVLPSCCRWEQDGSCSSSSWRPAGTFPDSSWPDLCLKTSWICITVCHQRKSWWRNHVHDWCLELVPCSKWRGAGRWLTLGVHPLAVVMGPRRCLEWILSVLSGRGRKRTSLVLHQSSRICLWVLNVESGDRPCRRQRSGQDRWWWPPFLHLLTEEDRWRLAPTLFLHYDVVGRLTAWTEEGSLWSGRPLVAGRLCVQWLYQEMSLHL